VSLTVSGSLQFTATLLKALDLAPAWTLPVTISEDITLANGDGPNQAEVLFFERRVLAASAFHDYDLRGSLLTPQGDPAIFAAVKLFFFRANPGNTGLVRIGQSSSGNPSNPWLGPLGLSAHRLEYGPQQFHFDYDPTVGWPVVDGASDILRVTNLSGTDPATYDIILAGVAP
jgi:hypothetical protein